MKAIFRYPGSKWSIADWIIDHFPDGYEKMVYREGEYGPGRDQAIQPQVRKQEAEQELFRR